MVDGHKPALWSDGIPEPPTVLVVEDDEAMLRLVTIVLHLAGFRVISAQDHERAIEQAMRAEPALILLDQWIQNSESGDVILTEVLRVGSAPILAFTTSPEEGQAIVQNGAADFLLKPFDPDELLRKVALLTRTDGVSP